MDFTSSALTSPMDAKLTCTSTFLMTWNISNPNRSFFISEPPPSPFCNICSANSLHLNKLYPHQFSLSSWKLENLYLTFNSLLSAVASSSETYPNLTSSLYIHYFPSYSNHHLFLPGLLPLSPNRAPSFYSYPPNFTLYKASIVILLIISDYI